MYSTNTEAGKQNTRPHITVTDLTMAYGDFVIQHDLNFTVNRGDIFIIMGGSGCGKTTLLRTILRRLRPLKGRVRIGSAVRIGYFASRAEAETFIRQNRRHVSGAIPVHR